MIIPWQSRSAREGDWQAADDLAAAAQDAEHRADMIRDALRSARGAQRAALLLRLRGAESDRREARSNAEFARDDCDEREMMIRR